MEYSTAVFKNPMICALNDEFNDLLAEQDDTKNEITFENINEQDVYGQTKLILSITNDKPEVLHELLSSKYEPYLDLDICCIKGSTALFQIFEYFINYSDSRKGNSAIILQILKRVKNINAVDYQGNTILYNILNYYKQICQSRYLYEQHKASKLSNLNSSYHGQIKDYTNLNEMLVLRDLETKNFKTGCNFSLKGNKLNTLAECDTLSSEYYNGIPYLIKFVKCILSRPELDFSILNFENKSSYELIGTIPDAVIFKMLINHKSFDCNLVTCSIIDSLLNKPLINTSVATINSVTDSLGDYNDCNYNDAASSHYYIAPKIVSSRSHTNYNVLEKVNDNANKYSKYNSYDYSAMFNLILEKENIDYSQVIVTLAVNNSIHLLKKILDKNPSINTSELIKYTENNKVLANILKSNQKESNKANPKLENTLNYKQKELSENTQPKKFYLF
jgi:hypothetical protein